MKIAQRFVVQGEREEISRLELHHFNMLVVNCNPYPIQRADAILRAMMTCYLKCSIEKSITRGNFILFRN
jgi:hypothetical protein